MLAIDVVEVLAMSRDRFFSVIGPAAVKMLYQRMGAVDMQRREQIMRERDEILRKKAEEEREKAVEEQARLKAMRKAERDEKRALRGKRKAT